MQHGIVDRARLDRQHVDSRAGELLGLHRRHQRRQSTTGPRAVLTRNAVGFISESARASIMPRVSAFNGTCSETMSAVDITVSKSTGTTPTESNSPCGIYGSYAMTDMPSPVALRADALPIRPSPTTPKVRFASRLIGVCPIYRQVFACPVCRCSKRCRTSASDKGNGMGGNFVDRVVGHIRDPDTALRGGIEVDRVIPRAHAGDQLQIRHLVHHLGGNDMQPGQQRRGVLHQRPKSGSVSCLPVTSPPLVAITSKSPMLQDAPARARSRPDLAYASTIFLVMDAPF